MREIVLDTETTGLDYTNGDRIIEIGCIELIDRIPTGSFYHTYIKTDKRISKAAYGIHNISNEFLNDKPYFSEIVQDFLDFIKDSSKIVIHNAEFDMGFINNELQLLGMPKISKSIVSDTLLIARKKYPGSPASLNALCKRFNISIKERKFHGALIDSHLLSMVYVELVGFQQGKIDFSKQFFNDNKPVLERFPDRKFKLTELEKKLHDDLKGKIGNSIWGYYK